MRCCIRCRLPRPERAGIGENSVAPGLAGRLAFTQRLTDESSWCVVSGGGRAGWHRLDHAGLTDRCNRSHMQPGRLVVDLGAGTGALTVPLVPGGRPRNRCPNCTQGVRVNLRANLSDHAAPLSSRCDRPDFIPPGRPFRLLANPPYALTAARGPGVRGTGIATPHRRRSGSAASCHRRCGGLRPQRSRRFRQAFLVCRYREAFTPPPVDSAVLQLRARRRR